MSGAQVKLCTCAHGSDCHAAYEDGLAECRDCDCRQFTPTGRQIAAQDPPRHWASGRTMEAQQAINDDFTAFLQKTADEVRRDMPEWMQR